MHTQTHAYNTIQYNTNTRTHIHTHNTKILTLIHTFKRAHIHAYNNTPAHTCMLIFSFLKTLKLTLVHTNTHLLLTYATHMIPHTHS